MKKNIKDIKISTKMVAMLVVIGHHKEETKFGDFLRTFMEAGGNSDITFYNVINSYSNGSSGIKPSREEVEAAEREIFEVMSLLSPNITIDVHTGAGSSAMCISELITHHQYDILQTIGTADCLYPVNDCWTTSVEKFEGIRRKSRLQSQTEFPFTTLEMWLDPSKNKPPFEKEVKFANYVINEVSNLYSS